MKILSLDLSTKFLYWPEKNNLDQFKDLHVVYLIIFPNDKIYCGYSSNISQRWGRGISAYRGCSLVYKAFQKYGWNNPEIKKMIIFTSKNKEQALNKEKEIIEKLNLLDPNKGYNLVEGGNIPPSWLGKHHTEETKKILSEKNKERWKDPITAEKLRKRMKQANQQHSRKSTYTALERKQIWGKHNIGKTPVNAKPILQLDLQTKEIINEYSSAGQAAKALNIDSSANIRRTANGKGKSAYGYGWRWKQ